MAVKCSSTEVVVNVCLYGIVGDIHGGVLNGSTDGRDDGGDIKGILAASASYLLANKRDKS